MDVRVLPRKLSGAVAAIASKSEAHRELIAAALADAPTTILCNTTSKDIEATRDCLAALGAKITNIDGGLLVTPVTTPNQDALLDCVESGSTLRFLLPVAAALGGGARLVGSGRLPERPLSPLDAELVRHGVTMSAGSLPLTLAGALQSGEYVLPGNVSSQYITGLLFALPLLKGDSTIRLTTPLESADYVDMTRQTLSRFGVEIKPTETGYVIPGRQRYHSPKRVTVGGDWSNAAFFLAAGALGGNVRCTGLSMESLQADRKIVSNLSLMGADWERTEGIQAKKTCLSGCRISVKDCPDLLPILAVTAAFAEGETVFCDAARLRIKESDRLSAMAAVLTRLGVSCRELPDGLIVQGGTALHPAEIDGCNDHRIVMAAAIALSYGAGGVIHGAEAVEKSYPAFFEDLNALGGSAHVI